MTINDNTTSPYELVDHKPTRMGCEECVFYINAQCKSPIGLYRGVSKGFMCKISYVIGLRHKVTGIIVSPKEVIDMVESHKRSVDCAYLYP